MCPNKRVMKMIQSNLGRHLSEKARENLRRNAELRNTSSKFLSFQPDEKKVLLFDPEKIKPVEREFDGKMVQKFDYTVRELNTDQERVWPVGKTVSEQIDAFLSEGHTLLRIQRVGLDKETRYHIIPA
jgi:hypothetical protein